MCLFITVNNRDLKAIYNWLQKWLVAFNATQTKSLILSNKHDKHLHPEITSSDTAVEEVKTHKHMG